MIFLGHYWFHFLFFPVRTEDNKHLFYSLMPRLLAASSDNLKFFGFVNNSTTNKLTDFLRIYSLGTRLQKLVPYHMCVYLYCRYCCYSRSWYSLLLALFYDWYIWLLCTHLCLLNSENFISSMYSNWQGIYKLSGSQILDSLHCFIKFSHGQIPCNFTSASLCLLLLAVAVLASFRP